MYQQTLVIIKPDAVKDRVIGDIISYFEDAGLRMVNGKMEELSLKDAGLFYREHEGKPFFQGLIDFMTSGPSFLCVFEGHDAIQRARGLIGATDPKEAHPDTLRARYGTAGPANAVHGSDSLESAKREVSFWFGEYGQFS